MAAGEDRTIDEKGRVTIPKPLRESLGLEPGDSVHVEAVDGHVLVRPTVSRKEFIAAMEGCIDETTERADADEIDPMDPLGLDQPIDR